MLKSLNVLTSTFLVGVVSISSIPQWTVHFTTGGSQRWLPVLAMVNSLLCYLGLHCITLLLTLACALVHGVVPVGCLLVATNVVNHNCYMYIMYGTRCMTNFCKSLAGPSGSVQKRNKSDHLPGIFYSTLSVNNISSGLVCASFNQISLYLVLELLFV